MNELMDIRRRVLDLVTRRYGRAQEELVKSGVVDSLTAVELAIALEQEFCLEPDSFGLSDMATLTSVSQRILSLLRCP